MTHATLPEAGTSWPELKDRMVAYASGDVRWREGRTAVYVFNAGPEVEQVQKEAYALFQSENGLGPAAFPSLKRMEEEVVGFGLSLLHAPEGAAGTITSGGTDSITMALKAARDFARKARGLTGPLNIVIPRSAHPAFDKAAALMEIEVRRTPLKDYLADPEAMAAAADDRTVMIVGSAPNFPYGLIDPVAELSKLAEQRDLWLHVDACVGGYLAPFVRMNGADIPPFDFEAPGVRSMSADLHKYGYAAKGASTVFFRSQELKAFMTFDFRDWPGGRMVTPTLAGTRPGGAISAAWAVMNFLGVEGYRARQGRVVAAREAIEAGVKAMGFTVLGRPQLGLIAFSRPDLDILAVWGKLREKGWFTGITTEPKSLHLMLSPVHADVAAAYLEDLAWAVEQSAGATPAEARYS
ncbi:MAG: aminotransferase class V-fold PLP-dependent enzyme [Phenylobacterium sp.]|jgi:glutamate/tyrosine decarboxylase-like PLP-dependent enzyme|uniref:aminotransferase class I/II-fold pyridoxal phosphate-dependent enzyme n=1 Tax=Phenylobacterium sp. TaxID=1871053 RepID=UPI002A36EE9A|nr:aminotransferase class I/II-fold pyridoxal phosphate-dependent enzyme [Phenylobacterium sp.]MDX9998384.1 aminotransferase class V-fold PLP-dependent enzyme [Phenylobacterium sp.]